MSNYIVSLEKQADIDVLLSTDSSTVKSMLVFGEPGAGKTSFAKHFAELVNGKFI